MAVDWQHINKKEFFEELTNIATTVGDPRLIRHNKTGRNTVYVVEGVSVLKIYNDHGHSVYYKRKGEY